MSDVPTIKEIQLSDDYILIATFDNGIRKQLDFKPLLELERFFALLDADVWHIGKITPLGSAVIWNHADMCENELYLRGITLD